MIEKKLNVRESILRLNLKASTKEKPIQRIKNNEIIPCSDTKKYW
jgi:hypothetical protein